MDKFIREYHDHMFVDDGAYVSEDFKKFARLFKNFLKRNLPDGCEILKHTCGHYFISGFVKKEEKYVYYSFSWNRYKPIETYRSTVSFNDNVLFRKALSDEDYSGKGGHNMFCAVDELPGRIAELLA